MAVSTAATSANFVGTGVLSSYAPGFYVNSSDQVKVYVGGVLKAIGDDYVVNNVGVSAGCTIAANFALGSAVYIERQTPITQLVDTQNNETILEDVLDGEFDKLTMISQEIAAEVDRAILFPKGESGFLLPAAAGRASKYMAFDAGGVPALVSGSSSTTTDAAFVAFMAAEAGAQVRSMQDKERDVVSLFDFMTSVQIADVRARSMTQDVTAAVQAAVNTGKSIYAPEGTYKLTSTITFPNTNTVIRGAGILSTVFNIAGVTGSGFKASAALTYFRPQWSDFSLVDSVAAAGGSATSTMAIDTTAINYGAGGNVLNATFRNLYLESGSNCFVCYDMFSSTIENVIVNSLNGHGFVILLDQSTAMINCYGSRVGTGKAAYRLGGQINMFACNGMDRGAWWGVFGQDPAATDGFQNDFPTLGTVYSTVNIIGGNMEFFETGGILVHNVHLGFTLIGQKWDRAGKSSNYDSIIRIRLNTTNQCNTTLCPGQVFLGAGVAKGPNGTATGAHIYTSSLAGIEDLNGSLAAKGITYFISSAYGEGKVPIPAGSYVYDLYQNLSRQYAGLTARRFSAQMLMYATSAALTPVGAAQAIDVTGYTKVTVTPAAPASISTATFTATLGTGAVNDYGRNGDLIIEAGNANLTINHSAAGGNTFRLKGAANITLATGEVRRFIRSVTSSQWVEV